MIRLGIIILILSLSACTPTTPQSKEYYSVATDKTASPEVYYPARWVRSPSPIVKKNTVIKSNIKIIPTFHYKLGKSNLCEIATAISASLKYSSYCISTLEEKILDFDLIATPYEAKDYIEENTGIYIVIDNLNKEIRFLSGKNLVPKFK